MRSLADLLGTMGGTDYLAQRGIFADRDLFAAALLPPAQAGLANLLDVDPTRALVYVGQQVCADYAVPTMAKFELASELAQHGIGTAILWHDMYQADADRFGTRILPPPEGPKARGIWLVPRAFGSREPRFIPVEADRLAAAFAGLRAWIERAPLPDRDVATLRLSRLEDQVLACVPATLAEATAAMAEFLLLNRLDYAPPTTSAYRMAELGLFTPALNEVLGNLDAFRAVFNAAVAELLAADIAPQVRSLPEDYLPLHYSDPLSGERLRLRHEQSGADHWATGVTRGGDILRFYLGSGRMSLGELADDHRWSLDVSMPVYHNDLASGWIAGRSTALYGLVFNKVLRDVLGRRPIPALVPRQLEGTAEPSLPTLLFAYLMDPSAASRA